MNNNTSHYLRNMRGCREGYNNYLNTMDERGNRYDCNHQSSSKKSVDCCICKMPFFPFTEQFLPTCTKCAKNQLAYRLGEERKTQSKNTNSEEVDFTQYKNVFANYSGLA